MNTTKPNKKSIIKMQKKGEEILDGFYDVLIKSQINETVGGVPSQLLASCFATIINQVSEKQPDFIDMVLAAVDRQKGE